MLPPIQERGKRQGMYSSRHQNSWPSGKYTVMNEFKETIYRPSEHDSQY